MPTVAVVTLPCSLPLTGHVRRLEEEIRRHSRELAGGASSKTREAKLEASLVKKDNDKIMDEIKYLKGRLKQVEKKHAAEVDKIIKEKM